ncbi:MAG: hypothetical protein U0797_23950 [Gemmataceae bacterium]
MATFYLLPARALLGDHVADALGAVVPGVDWPASARRRLGELLVETLEQRPEVFLVFREDLPPGAGAESALVDGYGAEAGDEVVEVRPGLSSRRWRVGLTAPLAA